MVASGVSHFFRAVFSGGTVDFTEATGTAPFDLVPLDGSPVLNGLILPSAWSS